jgi:hypothetical protein
MFQRAHSARVVLCALALLFVSGGTTASQRSHVGESATYHHLCTLIQLPWDSHTRVPAPELPAVAADGGATFQVTYNGFTSQAQTAFQRAADIWSGLVSSPRPIRITATFASLAPSVLGSAGATCYHRDFLGAPIANTFYPNPLADRVSDRDISASGCGPDTEANFEIVASFSSTANWYYGTDGNTPNGQVDFVSVVLHEIGHGLGFSGFASVSGGIGTLGAGSTGVLYPSIYDRFTVTETGAAMLSIPNQSAALGMQLTQPYSNANPRGPGVYFNGTNAKASNGGLSARLYTASTWSSGSSYSHLDESTYPAGNADSLMTYAIGSAEAIHHPGNVTLGIFKDMGWSTCPASLASTSASVAGAPSSGSVALTIESGCAWTARSLSSFLTISGTSSGTGSNTVSYAVAANNSGSARTGIIRISGVNYTVTQSANSNTLALSSSRLNFGGTNTAGTLSPMTAPQTVTVTTAGTGTIAWTASANQPWVQVSPASGTGSGSFTVTMVNPGNVLGASTNVAATVTVSSTNAGNTPTVSVNLSLQPSTTFAAPFGQVDTPAQNASGVQGAIGVTGWALDDVGVSSVKIYRNCLPFDAPASCQVLLGNNVVFVGDAAFLAGARTDVEAAFTTYPNNNRAGWGYLMLTSMLPNLNASQGYGGQGGLTLYVIASDIDGRQRLLGRSSDPASPSFATPTSITMDNAAIAKPFGAIDTPAQGSTVSGVLNNFGWVLTPDSNTTGGDVGDILIPTNGSTMTVFIDGLPTALVSYNQCRGSVGNPVAPTVYCNDDVANIFGNATPQASLTLRTSNPTKYRNLDAGRSAIGAFTINTATLSNGLHTIAWSVTDSAGRTEGIGSRFFNVLNSGADAGRDAALRSTPAQDRGLAATLSAYPTGDAGVWMRTGFDLTTPWLDLPIDRTHEVQGRREVTVAEGGRLELWLGAPVDAGYLVTPTGMLRDLPPGASLKGPQFAWVPPVGYVGDYLLAFIRGAERIDVVVHIR